MTVFNIFCMVGGPNEHSFELIWIIGWSTGLGVQCDVSFDVFFMPLVDFYITTVLPNLPYAQFYFKLLFLDYILRDFKYFRLF